LTAGTLASEAVRAALTGAGFMLLFLAAELWRRLAAAPVEWTRKLVHFGGGVIAAFFPWLFASHWTVLVLGMAFLALLWGTRRLGLLPSVHAVRRRSEGGIYFPIAIYLVFLLGADRPVFYLIAILALVVSDAAAAVLGGAYGRTTYAVEQDRRSLEGSTVFFFSTFLVVHLPLLLMTDLPAETTVLVGVQLALIVTLLEAISLEGNDNLIIPLATYFLLYKLTQQTPETLAYQLAAQLAIIVLLALVAWRYSFVTASGAMALMLFFYGAWSLGGEEWVVGPAAGLAVFSMFYALRAPRPATLDAQYQVVAAFYVCIVPTLLYIANNVWETVIRAPAWLASTDPMYAPFLGAAAAQLGLAAWNLEPASGGSPRGMPGYDDAHAASATRAGASPRSAPVRSWSLAALSAALAALVVCGTGFAAGRPGPQAMVAGLAIAFGGPLVYHAARHLRGWPRPPPWNVRLQAASVAAATAIVLPFWLRALRG
jgi:dolichol kinase